MYQILVVCYIPFYRILTENRITKIWHFSLQILKIILIYVALFWPKFHQYGWRSLLTLHVRTALYCTVLYCTVLYCTVLYCTVLYVRSLLNKIWVSAVPCRFFIQIVMVLGRLYHLYGQLGRARLRVPQTKELLSRFARFAR